MYVRRKNCEYGRIKRSNRKPKPCDTFSSTFGSYAKLFLIWGTIVFLDFLMEFRFEYVWPIWLLVRTVYDSFKYQGLTFAAFFTMIAFTSDFICYLLVPSKWLFLFGSTCVWMELVWHAERGICAPTVAMCFLFLYVEVAVRLRDPKTVPLSIDICRPFATHCSTSLAPGFARDNELMNLLRREWKGGSGHSGFYDLEVRIGYPVVTLGFGLKSLLTHQLRLRRQHQVETHNSKYFCLLELALPEEARTLHRRGELGNGQLAVMGPPNASTGNAAAGSSASGGGGGGAGSGNNASGNNNNSLAVTSSNANTNNSSANNANSTLPSTSNSAGSSSSKNSRKQQQQQQQQQHNLANGKSSTVASNFDHSLTSNHASCTDGTRTLVFRKSETPRRSQVIMISGNVGTEASRRLDNGTVKSCSSISIVCRSHVLLLLYVEEFCADGDDDDRFGMTLIRTSTSVSGSPLLAYCHALLLFGILATDRKVFNLDGSEAHHHHHNQQHHNNQQLGDSGEAPGVSSSCSSLSGQEPATAAPVETRSSKRSSAASSTAQAGGSLTQTGASAPNNRSKGNDKSSRTGKDASVYRMEDELRRLRHERQCMLVTESELRAQLAQLTTLERTSRTETNQARQEVEYLQSKLSTLTQRLETERENLQVAEKKAAEEKRQRSSLEVSLASEKRARREAENALKVAAAAAAANPLGAMTAANSFVSTPNTSSNAPSFNNPKILNKPGSGMGAVGCGGSGGGNNPRSLVATTNNSNNTTSGLGLNSSRCNSDVCTHRIHELEARLKALSRELKEAQLINASQSNLLKQQQSQQQHQSSEQLTDLMIHLNDLETENACLKAKLKAEDKMKHELLAGYHNSLKEITELNSTLTRKEYQIVDLYMRLDLMNPNSPFHYVLNSGGVTSDASVSSPSPDGRVGGHPRIPATNSFLNPTTSGGSLFSPPSTDFDFGVGGGGGGGGGSGIGSVSSGWPLPPFASPSSTAAANTSVAFSDQHLHHLNHQPPRLRSESTSAVLSALMSTPRGEEKSAAPSRFDVNAEVDLEAASSSLSTTEFLSKLRSQLAMSAAAANGQLPPSVPNQPAPISPPSRDISGGGGGGVGGIPTLLVGGGGDDTSEGSPPPVAISPLSGGPAESTADGEQVVVGSSGGGEGGVEMPEKGGGR
ncbi:hypothetical protein Aperf_G00000082080 [Anoplocephala perfoliata]